MPIYENLKQFAGMTVTDYRRGRGLAAPQTTCYRVRLDWDARDDGDQLTEWLEALLDEPEVGQLRGLVIGAWDFDGDDASEIVDLLANSAGRLTALRALFLGDIIAEEQEMSWIEQSDISPLFPAFPKLEVLRVRGSDGLVVGELAHQELRELAFESGGLPGHVIDSVVRAQLPQLERLELWLGTSEYGYDGSIERLSPLLTEHRFPLLRYLGLKNSEQQDEIARAIAASPLMDQLSILDLSMGTLSDEGARALLAGGKLGQLKQLDIHHHYVSDAVLAQLSAAVPILDASERAVPDTDDGEDHRYVAVSE